MDQLGSSEDDNRIRLRNVFEFYEECQHALTDKQWVAVCLRYRDGLTQEEIVARLGITRSAVSATLKRARENMEEHYRKLREDRFKLTRKYLNS